MAVIKPFACIRPREDAAARIAALPYDVYSREEAKEEVMREPLSFLKIDRAETSFDDSVDMYDDKVYKKAREILEDFLEKELFIKEEKECYYLYELIMNGRSQTGLVGCASIDDYEENRIKKHEKTRADKEVDRIRHVDTCNAQTGPIFLAYPSNEEIHSIVTDKKKDKTLYSFTSNDGVIHNVWKIEEDILIKKIRNAFDTITSIYIADGHHRAASAVRVGKMRREEAGHYTGEEEFNYFLSVLFPHSELMILPYNRVVKDLNGHSVEEFLSLVKEKFDIIKLESPYSPEEKGCFGMYVDGDWYKLTIHRELIPYEDKVRALDVSLLQDYILSPILGIGDPKVDKRIDFIGGIRGLKELEERVKVEGKELSTIDSLSAKAEMGHKHDMKVAFSMYPTSMEELFQVSDENQLMPPKSTWFEPKLRSGLFIHSLE